MTNLKLTNAIIRAGANEKSFARGQELFRNGAISDAAIQCNVLTGRCEDAQSPFYKARAKLDGGEAMGSQTTSSMDDHVFLFTQPLAVA
jgi:hypothetical protein